MKDRAKRKQDSTMKCNPWFVFILPAVVFWMAGTTGARAQEVLYPVADGTIVDGGIYGPFDGVPDDWDWTFDESGYEGVITLTTLPGQAVEHRVVWEYDLSYLGYDPPVTTTLTFTMRGVYTYPFPNSVVDVFAYPGNGWETPSDFSVGPAVLLGSVTIVAYQAPTVYMLNVTDAVNEALLGGAGYVGFRFQIDPDSTSVTAQAFIDALDTEIETKPYLTIEDDVPGDLDGDADVDLADFGWFASCMDGPGVVAEPGCEPADFDLDQDVDVRDFLVFEGYLVGSP